MKHKLCLHGLEVKNQAQLLNLAKRLLPGSTVKVKIKEKYFNDNDMYKYRLTRFTPENIDGVRLYCAWGTLLVSDKLLAIADIIIEFEYHNAEAAEAVDSLLQKLLASKTKFVLEEPDFSQRLDQLRGCFDQKQLAAYDADSAMSLLYCHLPWQVYYVSKLWQEVLSRGPERSLLRQLRVKLRRLRSLLTLCKPLLPEQEAVHWQGVLKASTNRLGDVREYDVALQICSRLQRSREQAVRIKLGALRSCVEGRRVVMIDDSIVRGTTSRQIVVLLREAGAVQVHLRISAPPFIAPCYFGTDIPDSEHLIAHDRSPEEICALTGADSLGFLPLKILHQIAPDAGCGFCDGCFTGNYPIRL